MDLKLEFTLFLFKNCIFLLKYNLIPKKKKKAHQEDIAFHGATGTGLHGFANTSQF